MMMLKRKIKKFKSCTIWNY